MIKNSNIKQLKYILEEYKIVSCLSKQSNLYVFNYFGIFKINTSDMYSILDPNEPISKALRIMQNILCKPAVYEAERLQKCLKTNKTEFLRLISIYSEVIFMHIFLNSMIFIYRLLFYKA